MDTLVAYFQYASFNNSRSLIFSSLYGQSWESGLPLSASAPWLLASTDSTSISLIVESQGHVVDVVDILNRAGLGMEVMHERNAHNFPLDLATRKAPVSAETYVHLCMT